MKIILNKKQYLIFKTNTNMKDSIVESVLSKYKQRSEVGINKYGVTLDRTDLTDLEWLIHAQEEAMDLSLYLEKLIKLKQL